MNQNQSKKRDHWAWWALRPLADWRYCFGPSTPQIAGVLLKDEFALDYEASSTLPSLHYCALGEGSVVPEMEEVVDDAMGWKVPLGPEWVEEETVSS